MDRKRQYLSEFSVNLCTSNWLLVTAAQLTSGGTMVPSDKDIADHCHIYVICRHPSLRFDPQTFNYSDTVAKGELIYRAAGTEHRIAFSAPFPLLDGATSVALSPYPHRDLRTFDPQGKTIRYLPASALSFGQGLHLTRPDLANLEVLYVGQAFAAGNRSAFERLQSHSTLQKILAEASYSYPDDEVLIAMFQYEPYRVMTLFDGAAKGVIKGHKDTGRFINIMDHPLKQSQQVSLAEAALIRYFSPKYNKVYKASFPSSKQRVLESCYKLDFSGLSVEIDTEDLRFRLYSENVKPAMHHIANIDLTSKSNRAGFFFFTRADGGLAQSVPSVIG